MTKFYLFFITIISALLIAACGSTSKDTTTSDSTSKNLASGSLTHADGTLKLEGDVLVVTSQPSGKEQPFQLGSAVERGTIQGLVASQAKARVFYTPSKNQDLPVAVSVNPAPSPTEGAKSYDGNVVSATDTSITINGSDGKRTFKITPKYAESFDIPHLNEHKSQKTPVRIYYEAPDTAITYEDA